jgi:hypothetical protein
MVSFVTSVGWLDGSANRCAFERQQSAGCHCGHSVGQSGILSAKSTAATAIGGSSDKVNDWVAAQFVVRAEAGDAAQHDTGRDRAVGVGVKQRVGEEPALVTLTLGEVGGELQVVGHSAAPIDWPIHAAVRPSTTLTAMLVKAETTCAPR